MCDEVRPDEPSPTEPRPIRKKGFTVKSLMMVILVVAIGLGLVANRIRSYHRTRRAQDNFSAWIQQVARLDPQRLSFSIDTERMRGDWFGVSAQSAGEFKTSAGRPIVFDFIIRNRLFDSPGQVAFSADGRSMTVPFEDIVRGRTIDLKAEFPESFR